MPTQKEQAPLDFPTAETASGDVPLAVFDLDGTLTTRSTFLPYLMTFNFNRRRKRFRPLVPLPFLLSAYVCRLMRDYELKERLMVDFLGGVASEELREHTSWFCEHWLPRFLHPVGVGLLKKHQQAGHRVLLLSASPDFYVPAIGEALGIPETICTKVAVRNGRCVGMIDGVNCKAAAKLEALKLYLKMETAPRSSFAYGDSSHDLPVLSWATDGYFVRRNSATPVRPRSASPPVVG